ncbi:hypothetical protein IFR05_009533 [Cadophora sp. M221]|nr:hypothetical protein IFR05_009533 [Cadophora sp. M221]
MEPRIVTIRSDKPRDYNQQLQYFHSSDPVPSILHACQESRLEALPFYVAAFTNGLNPRYTWTNFHHDTINLHNYDLCKLSYLDKARIRQLVVESGSADYFIGECRGEFEPMKDLARLEILTPQFLFTWDQLIGWMRRDFTRWFGHIPDPTMRLPVVLIVLFLTTFVCADGLANGYERMWIYYAYLLDVKLASVNGGTRSILLNCASDARFKDVMEAIDDQDWAGQRILPEEKNRFPPIEETVKRMHDLALTKRYYSEEVIKGQTSFTRMIGDLGWMVNDIKSKLTPEQRAPMEAASTRADESLRLARDCRAFEVSNFMWSAQNDLPGIRITRVPGTFGDVISWEQTILDNPRVLDARERIEQFKKNYYETNVIAEGHRGPLEKMKKAYNMQQKISCGS